jgi:hypothetical protein
METETETETTNPEIFEFDDVYCVVWKIRGDNPMIK